MKAKICSNCVCWEYRESIAGIGYGICGNEDSELNGQITPEDESCSEFEENNKDDCDE